MRVMRTPPTPLALALLVLLAASPAAHAGRGLLEPPSVGKAVRGAARADIDKALLAAGVVDRCKDALEQDDLVGYECRAVLAAALAHAKPVAARADLDARTALFVDLTMAAGQVASFNPLNPQLNLGRERFDAHRAISRALLGIYDDLAALRFDNPVFADADAFVKSHKLPACSAAARSVELATFDATLEERGAAQSLVTSHACFLDESRLKKEPKPGTALLGSPDAKVVAEATSVQAAVVDYAQSRKLDLQRCVDKHVTLTGKVDDAEKMQGCVCGAMGRWKFPAPNDALTVELPLTDAIAVHLELKANGAVSVCGPVVVKK